MDFPVSLHKDIVAGFWKLRCRDVLNRFHEEVHHRPCVWVLDLFRVQGLACTYKNKTVLKRINSKHVLLFFEMQSVPLL